MHLCNCGFLHALSISLTADGTAVKTDLFGKGTGGVFSVSITDSGSVISTQEDECDSDNYVALFCLGMAKQRHSL